MTAKFVQLFVVAIPLQIDAGIHLLVFIIRCNLHNCSLEYIDVFYQWDIKIKRGKWYLFSTNQGIKKWGKRKDFTLSFLNQHNTYRTRVDAVMPKPARIPWVRSDLEGFQKASSMCAMPSTCHIQ